MALYILNLAINWEW